MKWSAAAWAAALTLTLLSAGCRSMTAPGAGVRRQVVVVQALHRTARTSTGTLRADAPTELADAVVARLTGVEGVLDPWLAVADRDGRASVVAVPRAGVVSRAVCERLRFVAGDPAAVDLIEGAGTSSRTGRRPPAVLVLQPAWENGRVTADPLDSARAFAEARGAPATLIVADLTTPTVDGQLWTADEIVASRSPEAVALVVRYILQARASGVIPDAGQIAAGLNVDLKRLDWVRLRVGH